MGAVCFRVNCSGGEGGLFIIIQHTTMLNQQSHRMKERKDTAHWHRASPVYKSTNNCSVNGPLYGFCILHAHWQNSVQFTTQTKPPFLPSVPSWSGNHLEAPQLKKELNAFRWVVVCVQWQPFMCNLLNVWGCVCTCVKTLQQKLTSQCLDWQ